MKALMLVCEEMADEAMEDLGGKTPLEVAKTPNIDQLAQDSIIGTALFTPHRLAARSDVACLSLLGFDPLEFYTGIAPLEALAMGISQSPNEITFRCDLVTVVEDKIIDTRASRITPHESALLIKALNEKLANDKIQFFPGEGYKNILKINDPEIFENLDDLECIAPQSLIERSFTKSMPKGKGAAILVNLMNQSKAILEEHDINRVRIDLKENPANMIWPWGQGKKPKLPSFEERYTLNGGVVSEVDYIKGIGKALGFVLEKDLDHCIKTKDFTFFFQPAVRTSNPLPESLKVKIRRLEEFDSQIVGPALKTAREVGGCRVVITTDVASSLNKNTLLHGHVPFLVSGGKNKPSESLLFNEKSSVQSKLSFESGHEFMSWFLKS